MAVQGTGSYVNLLISNSVNSHTSEKRYLTDTFIGKFKGTLELVTGCSYQSMKLHLYDDKNKHICDLDDDLKPLGAYPVSNGMRIHVEAQAAAPDLFAGDEAGVSYEMNEEDYAKRSDTALAWKKQMKLSQFREVDPAEKERKEAEQLEKAKQEKSKAESIHIGDRCEVSTPNQPTKRGTVMFVGETKFKPGYWIGVKYDEPVGKNNGTVEGVRYFECRDKYGGCVKPQQVTVGDFPELGMEDLDEI